MDCSGNHNEWRVMDGQRLWATAAQRVAGQQSNCNGQWDGRDVMDGTMGSNQLPPMQSSAVGGDPRWTAAAITMDGGGVIDGQWQRQWATAMQ